MHAMPEEMIEDAENAESVWDMIEPYAATDIERVRVTLNRFRQTRFLTQFWADILWRRVLHAVDAIENPFDRHIARLDVLGQQVQALQDRIARALAPEFDAVATNTLADIAADSQGVHRRAVSHQTNAITEFLLKTNVPDDQTTLDELRNIWGRKGRKVLIDMTSWYEKETCRNEGDHFYQRLLDCVWARIKTSEHRDELTQRLLEEATESIGLCCEGHIVRLCNVFAGFYDECIMKPPLGDIVAEIARREISVEEKVLEAWKQMDELGIPEAERTAWIDAL
jgi:hypothetical protein